MIIAAALLIGARFLPHGSGPAAGPAGTAGTGTGPRAQGGGAAAADVFGIRTKSAGCPATLRVAAARCPASPECFGGIVDSAGSASAESVACDRPHYWETFAIAILPAEVRTFDQRAVSADPAVRTVCSQAVMLASRQGQARRLPGPGTGASRSCRRRRPPSAAARASTAASQTRSGSSRSMSQFRR